MLPSNEKSPIASLPALFETYTLNITLTPRIKSAVAVSERAFRKNLRVLDAIAAPLFLFYLILYYVRAHFFIQI